jgi:nitroimidazol reductase NimA-like FMN-containing flavoprotein (pyridoxamine 5'-phosphate oxidase superfamily)
MVDMRKTGATSRMHKADMPAAGSQVAAVVLRPLSPRRSEAVLARNSVGRIAFAHRGHVNIAPMLYVFIDGWLYARADAALRIAIRHNRWVAVEVAEVSGVSEWRSVVARGACHSTTARGSTAGDALAAGIERLRNRIPEMSRPGRGAPFRTAIYRVHVDELTGYAARPSRRRTAGAAAKRRATAAADQARADDDGMTQSGADDRR